MNVLNSCYASLYADDTVIYCYGTSSKELSDKLNNDLLGVAKWLHDHKLTLNLDKTKCMLIGSNQSGISLNLRTGPTGHTPLFNQ